MSFLVFIGAFIVLWIIFNGRDRQSSESRNVNNYTENSTTKNDIEINKTAQTSPTIPMVQTNHSQNNPVLSVEKEIDRLREEAITHKRNGNLKVAEDKLFRALKLDNSSFDALYTYYNLGKVSYLLGKREQAIQCYLCAMHIEMSRVYKDLLNKTLPDYIHNIMMDNNEINLPSNVGKIYLESTDTPRHLGHALIDLLPNQQFVSKDAVQYYYNSISGKGNVNFSFHDSHLTKEQIEIDEIMLQQLHGMNFAMFYGIKWGSIESNNVYDIYSKQYILKVLENYNINDSSLSINKEAWKAIYLGKNQELYIDKSNALNIDYTFESNGQTIDLRMISMVDKVFYKEKVYCLYELQSAIEMNSLDDIQFKKTVATMLLKGELQLVTYASLEPLKISNLDIKNALFMKSYKLTNIPKEKIEKCLLFANIGEEIILNKTEQSKIVISGYGEDETLGYLDAPELLDALKQYEFKDTILTITDIQKHSHANTVDIEFDLIIRNNQLEFEIDDENFDFHMISLRDYFLFQNRKLSWDKLMEALNIQHISEEGQKRIVGFKMLAREIINLGSVLSNLEPQAIENFYYGTQTIIDNFILENETHLDRQFNIKKIDTFQELCAYPDFERFSDGRLHVYSIQDNLSIGDFPINKSKIY